MRFLAVSCAALLLFAGGRLPAAAQASVRIDTRELGLQDSLDLYRETLQGDAHDRFHRVRIDLFVDGRKGFDPGLVALPENRISQRVDVRVRVRGQISSDVHINQTEMSSRARQVSQTIRVR